MNTSISLIQAPWLVTGTIKRLGGLACFRNDSDNIPRLCIMSKGMNLAHVLNLYTADLMVVMVTLHEIEGLTTAFACLPGMENKIPQRK